MNWQSWTGEYTNVFELETTDLIMPTIKQRTMITKTNQQEKLRNCQM